MCGYDDRERQTTEKQLKNIVSVANIGSPQTRTPYGVRIPNEMMAKLN